MIKFALALFIAGFSFSCLAASEAEYFSNFSASSNLTRTAQIFELCTEIQSQWPSPRYEQRILDIGNAWNTNPEAAYLLVSTCHSMWETQHLDPLKAIQITRDKDRSKFGLYISSFDVINTFKHLPEQIRLFLTVKGDRDSQIPPSPYEILTGMASSEREMDEVLKTETRETQAALIAMGGGLAASLKATQGLAQITRTTSLTVGRVAYYGLLITVVSTVASELAGGALWEVRAHELLQQVEISRRLMHDNKVPHSLAIDQFSKAIERLGYFYSYHLYLQESGEQASPQQKDEKCFANLRAYFSGQRVPVDSTRCRDAASLWINASEYLTQNLTNDIEAQALANRLIARAKRTVRSFEETRSYLKTLPICSQVGDPRNPLITYRKCVDPITGAETI